MIWVLILILSAAAAMSILWPLSRGRDVPARGEVERSFYDAQVSEIERDKARGLIGEAEAEGARAEAARRLIAALPHEDAPAKSSVFTRRVAAVVAIVGVPLVSIGFYLGVGHPAMPDRPLEARLNAPPDKIELVAAVARIERHLANKPEDGRGWQIIAPVYLRMSRYDDAAKAWANAIRALGSSPVRETAQGEALVFAAKGKVTPEAAQAFERALKLDPKFAQARFYAGLQAQQTARPAEAHRIWSELVADAPKNASWAATIRGRIAELEKANPQLASAKPAAPPVAPDKPGPARQPASATPKADQPVSGPQSEAGKAIASLPKDQQQAAIQAMVDSLAERLGDNSRDARGWIMLIRAYTVLEDRDKARAALARARGIFADDAKTLGDINAQAKQLGLEG